ncbi:unnamed protein product [Brassica napus]|uniref:(rape) hypothetical protein n=1 Tax=Brassica napus TaxID=3708 RepID=A0A816PKR6_BRANA|nr:unnamed protein product [Brassica napus]
MGILRNSVIGIPVLVVALFLVRVVLFKTGLIYTVKQWRMKIVDWFHVYQFYRVPEFNDNLQENQLYRRVHAYLNSLSSIENSDYTNLFAGRKSNEIILRLDRNQVIGDEFLGARVCWINGEDEDGSRSFVLKIRKADKRRILGSYLNHIHTVSEELEQRNKEPKLFMNVAGNEEKIGRWRSIPFTHPCTFDNIAMEADLKDKVKSDLESFLKGKQFYNRLGRVWKRSYLLYGPSGTGKSSFVAAMASFLNYDVYDIDLSKVEDDSDLKMILLQTTCRSVIVIEDLDRFLSVKSTALSVSGVLNFTDGILSSCAADERIMVFTMTSKEQIDPAVLRPGRVDVHIHFPLCDFTAFKALASSYLGLKEHKLFPQVEGIFRDGASLSPAEIGELMIANRNSPSRALKSVINALQTDGDRRGTPASTRRLFHERASSEDYEGDTSGPLCGGGSSPAVKEFKKLYGLLRLKSNRKSQSFNLTRELRNGFGFEYFEDERDAEDAIRKLHNYRFEKRRLSVEWGRRGERSRHGDGSYQKPTKTLFVCNFDPFRTKEVDIEQHFQPYGKVINVRIRSNYSFAQFATQADATKALEATQRSQILGKVIAVEYGLEDDDERDDRRGGGSPKRSPSPAYHRRPIPDYGRPRSPEYDRGRRSPAAYERRRSPAACERRMSPADYGRMSPDNGKQRSSSYDRYRSLSPVPRGRKSEECRTRSYQECL